MFSFKTHIALASLILIYTSECTHSFQNTNYWLFTNAFIPECHEALPGWIIRDPEFNQDELLTVWRTDPTPNKHEVKQYGIIYISPIDAETGNFSLAGQVQVTDGKPVEIDNVRQGPEWGNSQRGWEIFYTCYSDNFSPRLCRISQHQGNWYASALDSSDEKGILSVSKNENSAAPNIYYQKYKGVFNKIKPIRGHFGFRSDTSQPVDVLLTDGGRGRWMEDSINIVHLTKVFFSEDNPVTQIAIYNSITGIDKLIISHGREIHDAFSWNAPELKFRPAIIATVQNREKKSWDVEAYRENEQGEWIVWSVIEPIHSDFPINYSPEVFVYHGRSYVSIVSYQGRDLHDRHYNSSIVWIASIDPNLKEIEQVRRIISSENDPLLISRKNDPESLVISNGNKVKIYYLDFGDDKSIPKLMNCDSGLTPPD